MAKYLLSLAVMLALFGGTLSGEDEIEAIRSLNEMYLSSAVSVKTVAAEKQATGYLSFLSSAPRHVAFISNKHVFAGSKILSLTIPLLDTLTTRIVDKLQLTVELYNAKGESLFVVSKDSSDLALTLIPLDRISIPSGKKLSWWVQSSNIDPRELLVGQDVVFVGYPLGIAVNGMAPLMRKGTISGIDTLTHVIYLDADAFGGSSGSPVFLDTYSATNLKFISKHGFGRLLVGVISGYKPFLKLFRNVDTGEIEMIQTENSGLATVMPSDRIWELAKDAAAILIKRMP
jgi:hypothetical protein